jgi:hypothetical protein
MRRPDPIVIGVTLAAKTGGAIAAHWASASSL